MAGVYTSNSYNPLGAIQAGINNVRDRNKIKDEYWKRKGETWSNFAKEMGKLGGRLVDAYNANQEDPDTRLAELEEELKEAERVKAIEDKYNEQVEQRKAVLDYIDRYNQAINRVPEGTATGYDPMKDMYVARQSAELEGYTPLPDMNPYAKYLNAPAQGVYLSDIENEYRRRI